MDAQRRQALSSLVAAVVTTQAAAQTFVGPEHPLDGTGSAPNFSVLTRSGTATADDGVRLYYEDTGSGIPVIFVHEFAGDRRSWELQVRSLARWFRCITFNARGYPPSDVPDDEAHYSQARARDDIRDVLTHLRIERAHIIGLSMGAFATLHFGLTYPSRAKSLMIASCGYGADPDRQAEFRDEMEATAARIERESMARFAWTYAIGPARVQLQNKDPRGWSEFVAQLAEHSTSGSALTMRGVQKRRPSLWSLRDAMRTLEVPTLVVAGDEDEPCLEPALMMKRTIGTAGLAVIPKSGHTVNLEEPDAFNRMAYGLISTVEAGRWTPRDPRAVFRSPRG